MVSEPFNADLADREMFPARSVKVLSMSEREPEISASTTDTSASTAEFRRFAAEATETAPPWSMRASGGRVALLAVAVIVVAVILGIVAVNVIKM